MRRLLGDRTPKGKTVDDRIPVIDGDLPIGLTAEEAAELANLTQRMSVNDPGSADEKSIADAEVEEVSPVTVHKASRVATVRLEKAAGTPLCVELGRAPGLFGGGCLLYTSPSPRDS